MMTVTVVPYVPGVASETTLVVELMDEVHARLGASSLTLTYRSLKRANGWHLRVDFYAPTGKMFPVNLRLPPESAHETGRRIARLVTLLTRYATLPDVVLDAWGNAEKK